MEARRRRLLNFATADGNTPFEDWLEGLTDIDARNRIRIRLNRVAQGNLGDCKPVGEGVMELRLDFGPGYRLYFVEDGLDVILLFRGIKRTQTRDIRKAKEYWDDYNA